MKSLFDILRFIWQHPLASRNRPRAIGLFLGWQIRQCLHRRPEKLTFVEDSVLVVEKGMFAATGNIYAGLQEFNDMSFLLHVLRPGDTFVDIGANVGTYTILAAKNAGAHVIAFEPIPSTFEKLQRNVAANRVNEIVDLRCCGVGDKAGTLHFTSSRDSMNRVLQDHELAQHADVMDIPTGTLDELLKDQQPVLIKIDVEGFEWPVLVGAGAILASPFLKALIIELNGTGGFFGHHDDKIHELMVSNGFVPYSYEPFLRQLKLEPGYYGHDNTIYLKDEEWTSRRVKASRKYNILNVKV
jgi:FkbM family methyltransferase